jgi:tight adherence protein B
MSAAALYASLIGLGTASAVMVLAEPAAATAERWRIGRRVRTLRPERRDTARQSGGAAAILRTREDGRDLWLATHLPLAGRLRKQLAAAGDPIALARLLAATGLAAATISAVLAALDWPLGLSLIAGPLAAGTAAWQLVAQLARRRRERFRAAFPDAVGLMVRTLRAGLPVPAAIAEVGRAVPGPIGAEFRRVGEEMRLGLGIETALWAAAERIGLADFHFLVVSVSIQRETGGNLAETLAGLDETLRKRGQLHLKVRAMSAEARASALIIGSLPFAVGGLMALVAPDYLAPLFTTQFGKLLVGAGLASMATGAIIIAQMVKVDP